MNVQTTITTTADESTTELVTSTPSRENSNQHSAESAADHQVTSPEVAQKQEMATSNSSKPTSPRHNLESAFEFGQENGGEKGGAPREPDTSVSSKKKGKVVRRQSSMFSSPGSFRVTRFQLDTSTNSEKEQPTATTNRTNMDLTNELGPEANELYEKLVFIVYKLIWEGISGSNEEAWKVNKYD